MAERMFGVVRMAMLTVACRDARTHGTSAKRPFYPFRSHCRLHHRRHRLASGRTRISGPPLWRTHCNGWIDHPQLDRDRVSARIQLRKSRSGTGRTDSDARDALMSLQAPTLDVPTRRLRDRVKEEVVEALRSHRTVREVGLSGYYRR